jgi:hypothetical protein
MGVGRSHQTSAQSNPRLQPAVHGLDAGRAHARKVQRKRHRANRALTSMLTIIAIAAVGAAGWFAYSAYIDHDSNQQLQTDRRVTEIEQERQGRTTGDIIEQLQETPAWNGPGNPTFGVGSDSTEP